MYTLNMVKNDGDMVELVKDQEGFIVLSIKDGMVSQRVKGLNIQKYTNIILNTLCEQIGLDPQILSDSIDLAIMQDDKATGKLLN